MIGLALGSQIALFLVEAIFSLYISAVVIRLLLGFARADFNNPLSQFLVKVTNPVLIPMRRFIPSIGKIDTSAVILAYALTVIKVSLLYLIISGAIIFPGSLLIATGELIKSIIWIYIIALILQAAISWIGSAQGNPVSPLIHSLCNPLVRPVRKVIPFIGMMDLSPLVVILGLHVLLIVAKSIFPNI